MRDEPVQPVLVSPSTVMDPLNCAFVAFDSTIRLITAWRSGETVTPGEPV
jgi:hypothetical protein